jgi:deuterolysin
MKVRFASPSNIVFLFGSKLDLPLVASRYDFSTLGAGTYTVEASKSFQVAGTHEKVESVSALAKVSPESSAITIELKGDLAKRELKVLDKRARVSCSTSSYSSFISSS